MGNWAIAMLAGTVVLSGCGAGNSDSNPVDVKPGYYKLTQPSGDSDILIVNPVPSN